MNTISEKLSDNVKTERAKDRKTTQSKTVHEAKEPRGYLSGKHLVR